GTTTARSTAIPASNGEKIKGTWANLDNLKIANGNITITINITNASPSNMFTATYNLGNEPTSTGTPPGISEATVGASGNPVITVTFSKAGFTTVGTPTGLASSFTLDFHN